MRLVASPFWERLVELVGVGVGYTTLVPMHVGGSDETGMKGAVGTFCQHVEAWSARRVWSRRGV